MADANDVFEKVTECLVEALGVEEDEVEMKASLTADLGAESIDFLDIVFRLEKAFDIKIPRGELFPESLLSSPEFVKDGKMTEQGLEELRKRLPYADLSDFEQDPNVAEIGNLFTVEMMVKYVEDKLAAKA
ncbi:MAG: acyl carrier protein [Planctomycetes bacterium]|nr:acyl carrier protein [Planctomycetota bacterium]